MNFATEKRDWQHQGTLREIKEYQGRSTIPYLNVAFIPHCRNG